MRTAEDGVAKWLKQYGLFSTIVFLLPLLLGAQSFSQFKQTQASSLKQFADERDNKFAKYLKTQWRGYEATLSKSMYSKPKPKYALSTTAIEIVKRGPRVNIAIPKQLDSNTTERSQPFPRRGMEVAFFGSYIGFDLDGNIQKARFYPTDQNGVIAMFYALASSNYTSITEQIEIVHKRLNLNDWGVMQLVKKIAERIYVHKDEQVLFRWFILAKLGYDVKIATAGSHVVLLQKTLQPLYETPYYTIKGVDYYAIDYVGGESPGGVFSCEWHYPQSDKALDFSLKRSPKFAREEIVKTVHFSYEHEGYTFTLHLNKNLLDFLNTYPQVEYGVYLDATIDPKLYKELATQIRDVINGQKASYGLNFVLRFAQNAFGYQRDMDQFGTEKVMFFEQTLFYAQSDCEDRVILFAKLVKRLFDYGIVVLKYVNHMSTALAIPMHGDTIHFARRNYVVADPTYLNANIGKAIPKYKGVKPEGIVRLSN